MDDNIPLERRRNNMNFILENHVQTAIVMMILGVLGWVGFKVTEQTESTAATKIQIEYMQRDIGEIKGKLEDAVTDRWTRGEQIKFAESINSRMSKVESRVSSLEAGKHEHKVTP